MWPFDRQEPLSIDAAMTEAASLAAEHWTRFCETSGIPANLHLRDRVAYFAGNFRTEMSRRFPVLRHAPDELVLLTIAQGIELSGREPRRSIERQLGIVLP